MADPELPLTGENVVVRIFLGNQPFGQSDTVASIKVSEDATIHKDPYLGRRRNRLDKQVNGFDCSIAGDMTNSTLFKALMAQSDQREANQPIPDLAIEVQLRQRNGLIKSFVLAKGVSKFDINAGGRTERVKIGLDMSFEEVLDVAL
jgi:hypothetical protein